MDYRHVALDELKKFADDFPKMTLGEILYSSLRNKYTGLDVDKLWQLTLKEDDKLYSCINRALKDETEQRDETGKVMLVTKEDLI